MLPSQSVSLHPHFPIVPIRRHFCSSLRRTGHGRISAQNKENAPSDYLQLEMEVFQFMESSGQLDVFPSKKDLINAGRYDLANSIEKQGGWLAVGFEDEAEEDFSGPSQFSAAGELVDPSLLNWSQSLDRSKASRLRTSNRIHFGGSAEQGVGSREPVVEDLTEVQTSGLEFLGSEILGPSAEVRGADADLTEVQTSGLEFLDSGVVGPSADVRSADVSGGLPAVESSQIPEIKSERSFLSQLDAVRDKLLASLGLDFPPPVIPKYETPVSSAESLELESEMPEPGTLGSLQPQEARVGDSGIGELSSKDRSFELELEWPQPGTSESLSLQPQESIVGDSETAAERIEQSKGGGLAEEEVPDVDSETRQLAESGQEIEGQSGGESEESAQDTVPVGAEGIAPGVAQESAPGVNATQRPSGAAEQEENAASTELEVLVGGEGTTDSAEEESTSEGALDTGSSSEAGGLSGLPALWQTNRGAALGQDSSASGPTLSAADSGDGGKRIGAGKRGEEIAAKKGGVSHEVEGKGRATEREGKAETVGSEVEAGRGGSPEGSETRTGETDRSQEGKGSETRMGERDRRSQEGKKSETRSGETDGSQEGKGRGGASSAAAESDGAPARPR